MLYRRITSGQTFEHKWQLEHKWHQPDWLLITNSIVNNKLVKQTRMDYDSDKVQTCSNDHQGIFRNTKHLLGSRRRFAL